MRDVDDKIRLALAMRETSCTRCTRASCCRQKVMADYHEAIPLAASIRWNHLDTPALRISLKVIGEEMEGSSRRDWLAMGRPCVFLHEERCMVYPARPTACRTHFVTSDPASCGVPDAEVVALDLSHVQQQMVEWGRALHEKLKLEESSDRVMHGTLPRMVLVALEALDHPTVELAAESVRSHVWPSVDQLPTWIDGDNPFRRTS